MKLDRDKLPVPDWLRAQLKTIVIGQDGFLSEARGTRVHQMQHAKTGLLSCVIKVASQISKRSISKL